ncbi:MAG: diguanylate cyclase (GGDEF)-like protein [Sulfurimonas sp.]|jgi:diguanylate cyclase (GGDEF)-like protein
MLDIDYFKNINDTYGHQAGDSILISVVREIEKTMRESDIFAFVGGEEFTIFLNDTSFDRAKIIAEKYVFLLKTKNLFMKILK